MPRGIEQQIQEKGQIKAVGQLYRALFWERRVWGAKGKVYDALEGTVQYGLDPMSGGVMYFTTSPEPVDTFITSQVAAGNSALVAQALHRYIGVHKFSFTDRAELVAQALDSATDDSRYSRRGKNRQERAQHLRSLAEKIHDGPLTELQAKGRYNETVEGKVRSKAFEWVRKVDRLLEKRRDARLRRRQSR